MGEKVMEIERIRQLKSRYFRFVDTKDWSGLSTIFAMDAVFDARLATTVDKGSAGDPNWYAEGQDNIVAFIREVVEHRVTAHQGHNHEVEILNDNHARGIIALEDWIWTAPGNEAELILHGWGFYEEEYRLEGGEWRISRSVLTRLNLVTG